MPQFVSVRARINAGREASERERERERERDTLLIKSPIIYTLYTDSRDEMNHLQSSYNV